MLKCPFSKTTCLVFFILFLLSSNLYAQNEIVLVTASGFGGTREKALNQASLHAVLRTVDKHFVANKAFAAIRKDVRQFIEDSFSDYVDDLSNVKIIKKYRRNKITARIPVIEAELISAVKARFPDIDQ